MREFTQEEKIGIILVVLSQNMGWFVWHDAKALLEERGIKSVQDFRRHYNADENGKKAQTGKKGDERRIRNFRLEYYGRTWRKAVYGH